MRYDDLRTPMPMKLEGMGDEPNEAVFQSACLVPHKVATHVDPHDCHSPSRTVSFPRSYIRPSTLREGR